MQYQSPSEKYQWFYVFDLIKVQEQQFCMGTVATVYAIMFNKHRKSYFNNIKQYYYRLSNQLAES